jgi:four helix bundle protein
MPEIDKGNIIVEKSFELALTIIDFCELLSSKSKFVFSNQLLRCGTSIGAMVAESQDAESKADFVHKMKIALKEAKETHYWLSLCEKSSHLPSPPSALNIQCEEVIRILSKIVVTAKTNNTGK